jgi:hypothetical protein
MMDSLENLCNKDQWDSALDLINEKLVKITNTEKSSCFKKPVDNLVKISKENTIL